MKKTLLIVLDLLMGTALTTDMIFGATQIEKHNVHISLYTGKPTDMPYAFTDSIRPVFVLPDGEVAKWGFSLYTYLADGQAEEYVKTIGYTQYFELNYDDVKWVYGSRVQVDGRSCLHGLVSYVTLKGATNVFDVFFDLKPPSKPRVTDVSYTYERDYTQPWPYLEGDMYLTVEADGADRYYVSYSTEPFLFSPPDWFGVIYGLYETVTHPAVLRIELVNWGEYFFVGAGNQYGWSRGDTLCTTDYISDTELLAEIEALRQADLGISATVSPSDPVICLGRDRISFNVDMADMQSYDIHSVSGERVCHGISTSEISTRGWRKGLYIVSVRTRQGKKYIIKYNKL